MERLTNRIIIPKEERDIVVFTQGEYTDTIPAEMTHEDIRKVLRKLAEYEEAEEQGLLLRLPCKVESMVYVIDGEKIQALETENELVLLDDKLYIFAINSCYHDYISYDMIGKTVFLTKEEAEQKLKEMESD